MPNMVAKVLNIYKNLGVRGLANKIRSSVSLRVSRTRSGAYSLEQKNLEEEFGFVANDIFQITTNDIAESRATHDSPLPKSIRTATWFIPYFNHIAFGGIQTIFRCIEKLGREGVNNTIVIYDMPSLDVGEMRSSISTYFPALTNYEVVVFSDDKLKSLSKLPETDIAFCTHWISAYILLRFNKTKRKYYFIQDYEPFFYVAGSTFALAESTYRFGFRAIVNTPGLFSAIKQRHGIDGISFVPAVNRELYYPDPNKSNKRTRIFFYARPNNPRNAFNLGVITIKHLLDRYGDRIEIITAGADWDENLYGLKGMITNLGLIQSIDEVAALYRTCDIGFAYMLNKHPSYQMLEYASSGVATVMNYNEDHLWLYKDGVNCLLAEPSPASMAEKIGLLIDDPKLREKIVEGGLQTLRSSWDEQNQIIWEYIKSDA